MKRQTIPNPDGSPEMKTGDAVAQHKDEVRIRG
jgi:hypothetical protein